MVSEAMIETTRPQQAKTGDDTQSGRGDSAWMELRLAEIIDISGKHAVCEFPLFPRSTG